MNLSIYRTNVKTQSQLKQSSQPQATTQILQQSETPQELKQKYGEEQKKVIDEQIAKYQKAYNDSLERERLLEGEDRDNQQTQTSKFGDIVAELKAVKSKATGDYETGSLINYAISQGEAPTTRFEYSKSKEYLNAVNENIIEQVKENAKKSGRNPNDFKPVYVNGKLTGFEDTNLGKSISVSTFEKGYDYSTPETSIKPETSSKYDFSGTVNNLFGKDVYAKPTVETKKVSSSNEINSGDIFKNTFYNAGLIPGLSKGFVEKSVPIIKEEIRSQQAEEPYGAFGWAKATIEYLPYKIGSFLETQMNPLNITVAREGTMAGSIVDDKNIFVDYTLEKAPDEPPINIFGHGSRAFGQFFAYPFTIAEQTHKYLTKEKSIYEWEQTTPEKRLIFLGQIGLAIAQVKGGYNIATSRNQAKINEAIRTSKTKTNSKVYSYDRFVKEVKIDNELKKTIRTTLDKGGTFKYYETILVNNNPKLQKYLPKVKGRYIEVIRRDGNLLERVDLGKTIIQYGKKKFTTQSVSSAIGKLDGDTSKYFTRTIVTKREKVSKYLPFFTKKKKLTYLETLEEARLVYQKKKGYQIELAGEVDVGLLKEVKFPKKKSITKLTIFDKVTEEGLNKMFESLPEAKPIGKGKSAYYSTKVNEKILIKKLGGDADIQNFLIGAKKYEKGKGIGIFEDVKPKVKPTKIKDGISFGELKANIKQKPYIERAIEENVLLQEEFYKPKEFTGKKSVQGLIIEKVSPSSYSGKGMYERTESGVMNLPGSLQGYLTKKTTMDLSSQIANVDYEKLLTGGIFKVKYKEQTYNVEKVLVGQVSETRIQTKEQNKLLRIQKPKENYTTRLDSVLRLATPSVSKLKLKQQQINLIRLGQPTRLRPRYPTRLLPKRVITPPPIPPRFNLNLQGDIFKPKKQTKKAKPRKFMYSPSVGAFQLGITSTKSLKELEKNLTGLELRPIQVSKKKKVKGSSYEQRLNKAFSL